MTVTWDNKSSYHDASNGGRTLSSNTNGVFHASWSTFGVSTGKWYWEVQRSGSVNIACSVGCGVSTPTSNVGVTIDSWGYQYNGYKSNNNAFTLWGNTYDKTDCIGIALDLDNGKIFFSKNETWQGSGNPVTGANPTFTGLSGTIKPGVSMYNVGNIITGNFRLAHLIYAPPTGYSALDSSVDNTGIINQTQVAQLQQLLVIIRNLGAVSQTQKLQTEFASVLFKILGHASQTQGFQREFLNNFTRKIINRIVFTNAQGSIDIESVRNLLELELKNASITLDVSI
jgi:hypothetical protein